MEHDPREEIRHLDRLCVRHSAHVFLGAMFDGLPSEGDPFAPSIRQNALDGALSCARCRKLNDLDAPEQSPPGKSGPVWNPSTANFDPDTPLATPGTAYKLGGRTHARTKLNVRWVIGGTCILTALLGLILVLRGHWPSSPEGTLVDYPELKSGDCVEDMVSEETLDLLVVSCKEPHTDEVIATFTLPQGKWPGTAKVDLLSRQGCASAFERYVGVPPEDSSLELYDLPPLKIDWRYDRLVVCTVAEGFEPNTGSLRNANR